MARGQRSGWRSTRRRRISYGACWPEVFRIYLPSVLRSSGSSPAPHSQVQLISQLIYLTIHLSTYLIIHLTTHLSHNLSLNLSHNSSHNSSYNRALLYISVCLSVYLFFFFNTVHLSQLLCLLFYDCVSLTLLAYLCYLLVEPFFSTIFFRVFVSHKLLMVLYICLLIFRTCLMISLTVVKILVVYPRLMLWREGGTPVRLSSLTSLTLFITKSKPLRRVCSHNLEESTRTTRGPVCFRPKYVCWR